jgi:hypothetical protein
VAHTRRCRGRLRTTEPRGWPAIRWLVARRSPHCLRDLAGTPRLEPYPESLMTTLEEVATAARGILHGETVTFHGRHVNLDVARLTHPPTPPPPLNLGVRGPKGLRLASRIADGTILAEGSGPPYVAPCTRRARSGVVDVRGWAGDHPRVRGERGANGTIKATTPGSPPRTRGARSQRSSRRGRAGGPTRRTRSPTTN